MEKTVTEMVTEDQRDVAVEALRHVEKIIGSLSDGTFLGGQANQNAQRERALSTIIYWTTLALARVEAMEDLR